MNRDIKSGQLVEEGPVKLNTLADIRAQFDKKSSYLV